MTTVAIIGAGDIGGASRMRSRARDRVGHVSCSSIRRARSAAGKALDIQQSGAISGFHARLDGTDDASARDRLRSV